jgi:hypothetical protein
MITTEKVEGLLVIQEAFIETMLDQAKSLRASGNDDAAKHCSSLVEGMRIANVQLRCLLEPSEVEAHPLLRVVS